MAVHVEAPALVPPLMSSVMLDWPLVTSEVRMFSMEAAVKAQLLNAKAKAFDASVPVVLNMLAGNDERLEQFWHKLLKVVPALKLRAGKDVRLLHPYQVLIKLVPDIVLIRGKETRLEHPSQVL